MANSRARGLVLLVLTLLVPVQGAAAPGYLMSGDFLADPGATPPASGAWTAVDLPHFTPVEDPTPRTTWYRLPVEKPMDEAQLAVYLWRFSMNAEVWLNDTLVGGGGSFADPITRNWNRPFLYHLPSSAWQAGDNHLYIRLASYPGWGYLAPPIVGTYDELEPEYRYRHFWQISSNEFAAVTSLLVVLVSLTFWLSDRSAHQYGLFALLGVSWTVFALSNFVQDSPVSAKTWWWLVHVSLDANVVLLFLFFRRLAGIAASLVDYALLGLLAMSAVFYAVLPLVQVALLNIYTHGVAVLLVLCLMVYSGWRAYRAPRGELIVFALAMLMIFVFALHDFLMISKAAVDMWRTQFFWLQFAAPVFMISMMLMLANQFANRLREERDAELKIRQERERIYSDVHDDVGSRLLSLVYAAETETQADLAREALRETREIVKGALSVHEDVPSLLSRLEAETLQRCQQSGIRLDWRSNIPDNLPVSATFLYHLQRIVRELVSNVIKHAGAGHLVVDCQGSDGTIVLTCCDDGRGLQLEAPDGVGIAGIQRRATELGGTASWENPGRGCRASVVLPLAAGVTGGQD